MINWDNDTVGKHPLTLNARVRVKFRDGSIGNDEAVVKDYHGCGDESSNWLSVGEPEDIVAYEAIAA